MRFIYAQWTTAGRIRIGLQMRGNLLTVYTYAYTEMIVPQCRCQVNAFHDVGGQDGVAITRRVGANIINPGFVSKANPRRLTPHESVDCPQFVHVEKGMVGMEPIQTRTDLTWARCEREAIFNIFP